MAPGLSITVAAVGLVDHDARLIGIDYRSIGVQEAHRLPLEAGVAAVEGLDLRV